MKFRIAVLLLALSCHLSAAKPAETPIPLQAFFGLPNIRSPELSPDGARIAFLVPVEDRLAIGCYEIKTAQARVVLRATDENIRGFFWKGNDHLVFYADVHGNESSFIGSTDLSGKKIRRFAESQKRDWVVGTTAGIVDTLRFDPEHIVLRGVSLPNDDHSIIYSASLDALKVNVVTGAKSVLLALEPTDGEIILDNAGQVRLRRRDDNGAVVWQLRSADDPVFREVSRCKRHGYAEQWEPLVFSADNEILYIISREEYDRGALYAYNTRTRSRGPAVFVPPEGEISRPILSYDRTKLYGVAYEGDEPGHHWMDPQQAQIQTKLERTFPGEVVDIVSRSADEQIALVRVYADRDPGTYYIFSLKAGGLAVFKHVRDLDPRRLRPMKPIAFKARDGLELHGYLTLPAGADGRRVPIVIHLHGGPFGVRDSWGYDPEVQFLASRGYGVLQVNYRGSGGYGREFIDKGRYQWGRAMQDDLSDAVRWSIDQGVGDPERIAIFGASYGGYAALAGVTLTPDLYCCAVNYVGPADLTITFASDNAYYTDYDYQNAWVGPNRAYLEATSPLRFIDRIRVPTLHAYGENDPRVKIKHWNRLKAELKKYDKSYVAIEEQEQGHGFRDAKASLNFYSAVEKFFAQYLGPEHLPKANASLLNRTPSK